MKTQYIAPEFRDAAECQSCVDRANMDAGFLALWRSLRLYHSLLISWLLEHSGPATQSKQQLQALFNALAEFTEAVAEVVEMARVADALIFDQFYIAMAYGTNANALTTGVTAHLQYWRSTGELTGSAEQSFSQLQQAHDAVSLDNQSSDTLPVR